MAQFHNKTCVNLLPGRQTCPDMGRPDKGSLSVGKKEVRENERKRKERKIERQRKMEG